MTIARGSSATLMTRFQTAAAPDTFATPEAAGAGDFRILPFYSYNLPGTEELAPDEAISGEGGDAFPTDPVPGLRGVTGSLVVPLGLQSLGWHLAALLGAPVTTGAGPDYTHVFEAGAVMAPRHLTNGISFTDIDVHRRSSGVTYTGFQLAVRKAGQRDRMTINAVGHDDTGVGAAMDSAPVASYADEWVPTQYQAVLAKDGVTVSDVTGFDLTIGSGIEADQETINGLATAADVILGQWSGEGSVTTRFRDASWLDLADAGTLFDLTVTWLKSATESIVLRAHNVRLARTGVAIEGRGVISQSFNLQIARPDSADVPIRWTVKNQTADYANLV